MKSTESVTQRIKSTLLRIKVFTLVLFLFWGCDRADLMKIEDNIDDYTYNPSLALPLINSKLTLQDIIDEDGDVIGSDETGLIWLTLSLPLFSSTAAELFQVMDQQNTFMVNLENPTKHDKSSVTEIFPFVYDGNELIDSVLFKSGNFSIEIMASELLNDGHDLEANISFPESRDLEGNPLSETFLISEGPHTFSLEDYTLIFENDPVLGNYFDMVFTLEIIPSGSNFNYPYPITVEKNITGIEYEDFYGFIGEIPFDMGTSDSEIDIFQNSLLGDIYFNSPIMRIKTINSFGIPLVVIHDVLFAYDDTDSLSLQVNDPEFHPWLIQSPNTIGETALDSFLIDKNNSNLADLINQKPSGVNYSVTGVLNFNNDPALPTYSQNLVKYNSALEMDAELKVPLDIRMDNLSFQDTIDFSIEDIFEVLEYLELFIDIQNDFPWQGSLQIYFGDENYALLDSLFTYQSPEDAFFVEAETDNQGISSAPGVSRVRGILNEEQLEGIIDTKFLLLKANLSTIDAQNPDAYYEIRDYYEIDIKMGVRAKGKYTVEFNPDNQD